MDFGVEGNGRSTEQPKVPEPQHPPKVPQPKARPRSADGKNPDAVDMVPKPKVRPQPKEDKDSDAADRKARLQALKIQYNKIHFGDKTQKDAAKSSGEDSAVSLAFKLTAEALQQNENRFKRDDQHLRDRIDSAFSLWPSRARSESPGACSDDSSKVTNCSSKRSKCKSEAQRGPRRAARKLERAKAHALSKGVAWDPNLRQTNAKKALSSADPRNGPPRGTVAVCAYQQVVEEMSEAWTEENWSDVCREALNKETPLPDLERFIEMRQGEKYCTLCKKWATDTHLKSDAHEMKCEETCISDAMGGRTVRGTRRFGEHCQGTPTKKGIREFWGDHIEILPQSGKEIHARKGCFYINSQMDKPILPKDAKIQLGIVSYSGGGKYHASTYIPYHELPDCEEVATPEQLAMTSPPGQGWWPVLELCREYDRTGVRILLVCFYQLMVEDPLPVPAWWIYPDVVAATAAEQARSATSSSAASSWSVATYPRLTPAAVHGPVPPPPPPERRSMWSDEAMQIDEVDSD
jgi:hypothetical protein